MKKLSFKKTIVTSSLVFLFLTGCCHFNFINQPYTADPNSSFDVQISVTKEYNDNGTGYFGVMLPAGWTIMDSILYTTLITNDSGFIVYSESLSQQMSSIDPPAPNYYWWVGKSSISGNFDTTLIINLTIYTDNQTGGFYLDYMLGDAGPGYYHGLNMARSNNHCIVVGDPVGCLPEGIMFSTQEEIDSFQTNYPNCTEIEGDVTIVGDDITNLNGLSVLTSIGGNLLIGHYSNIPGYSGEENPLLTNLMGLEGLISIGGNLLISSNAALTNLSGLDTLTTVGGGYFTISNNPALTSLTGLDNVTSIGGSLFIEENDALTSLSGLQGLTSVVWGIVIDGNYTLTSLSGLDNVTSIGGGLSITGYDALTNLSGLDNVASIGGDLYIKGNYTLTSLSGLYNVASIGGDLYIKGNYSLTSLSGLDNVASIWGDLYFQGNNALTSLSGLDNVTSIGGRLYINNHAFSSLTGLEGVTSIGGNLIITNNDALTSLSGLDNVTSIGGGLSCNSNNNLTSLTGLDNVTSIGIDNWGYGLTFGLTIDGNLALTSLSGLDNVISIIGDLNINNNPLLPDLMGLDNVDSIGGSFSISENSTLTSLAGLENLTSIKGNLSIGVVGYWGVELYGNPALINLTGLSNLTSIGGYLTIIANDTMASLTGLNNVTSIGGSIYIKANEALTSLEGLENIDADSIENVYIFYNTSLSSCEVQSICDYLGSPNGEIEINDNATGCNSQEEVEEACEIIIVKDLNIAENYSIYPNPTTTKITIELLYTSQKNALLIIYNMNTQQILTSKITKQKTVVDVSGLPDGIYFMKVADDRTVMVSKIVKK